MSEEPAIYHARELTWDEVKDGAGELFNVWVFGGERQWAERAWSTLAAAGLTTYGDDLGLTRVKVRLLALGCIYRDFCKIGCDEDYDECAFMWEEGAVLSFSNFRLGQLAGPAFDTGGMEAEDNDLSDSALFTLTAEERPVICRALVAAAGGAVPLAESLFATSRWDKETDGEEDADQRCILDENINDAGRVLEWIESGMNRL